MPLDDAPRLLSANRPDRLLQLAHARLARVVADDVPHRILGKLDLLRRDPVLLDLARNQVAVGDMHLLLFAVALQGNHLHAVHQRRRHRVQHVRRADEQHLRQIERHVEVVVAEGVVLLRIQRLQQRRSRIAAEVPAQLVHLVEHDHRVVGFRPADALDDLAGQRADVSSPMAANLRLVVHAAQRDALELAAQRARNRPAQAGFAHARRPDEAQNRPLHVRLQFQNAQVVENAVLHLLQFVVILVQNLLGLANVDLRARALGPRQHRQPLDVVAGERVVGGHGRHARQARQLLQGLLLHVLGHAGGVDLLAQLLDLALALVLLAQLLLDGLELLAQIVVALRLLHLVLHLGLDLGAQLLHLDLLGQMLVQQLQPRRDAGRLQQLLLVVGGQEGQRGGDKIHQPARLLDVGGNRPQLVGERRRLGDDLLELRDHVAHQRFNARAVAGVRVLQSLDLGHHEGLGLRIAHQPHPLTPSVKTNRLWLGMRTTLCTVARVPTACRSPGLGESSRGSSCAATTIARSSPSDSINWMELSRPTVRGSTAWGNRTVSRTGSTGIRAQCRRIFVGVMSWGGTVAGLALSVLVSTFLH